MGRQFSLAQWGQILYEVEFDFYPPLCLGITDARKIGLLGQL